MGVDGRAFQHYAFPVAGDEVRCAHTPRLVALRGLRERGGRWHVACASCGAVWGPYARREEALEARVRVSMAGLATARRLEAKAGESGEAGHVVAAREPAGR
jgi:uncharacterized Zn finger protein